MAGKRGLVMGVANERSIAWGIAQALHGAGAEMAFTYQGAAFGKRVLPWSRSSARRSCRKPMSRTSRASMCCSSA
jgi:Enoyl-[acyl-carrier-protein] reductase (NADH)